MQTLIYINIITTSYLGVSWISKDDHYGHSGRKKKKSRLLEDLRFYDLLIVIYSYQNDGNMMMKSFPLQFERFPPPMGLESGTLDEYASA